MNYNPYYFSPFIAQAPARTGIFRGIIGGAKAINWSGILNGTQKALNIANQAIPVIKQVSPMMQNAKTMFKVMNEFKKVDTTKENPSIDFSTTINDTNKNNDIEIDTVNSINSEGPTFFI